MVLATQAALGFFSAQCFDRLHHFQESGPRQLFKAVTISPRSIDVDVGQIAEALVYYGNVNVVCSRGVLAPFVQKFGYENLVRAMDQGLLTLS
jgi:hypothetical protein